MKRLHEILPFFVKSMLVSVLIDMRRWEVIVQQSPLVYLKYKAKYAWCLSNLVSSLRINTFTKIDLKQWLNEPFTPSPESENQLFE